MLRSTRLGAEKESSNRHDLPGERGPRTPETGMGWRGKHWRALLGMVAALGLAACGGAQGEAASPEQDSLAAELQERATELETELAQLEGGDRQEEKATETVNSEAPAEQAPGDEPAAGSAPDHSESVPMESESRRPSKRDRCRSACLALASMQRSSERICELVGSAEAKCKRARSQVEDARRRVQRAGCSCEP
ncbi:MAG: hypothetical protein R3B13_27685 [Polyangiaceae bacterium]